MKTRVWQHFLRNHSSTKESLVKTDVLITVHHFLFVLTHENVTIFFPFSVNCWPSDNGQGGCDVNIEYELEQDQLELQDVVITIPIP